MQHAFGVITVVQESRFRLASDDGRSLLFALHHGAPVEPQDLPHFVGCARVEVAYSTPADRNALTAHDLRPEDGR